MEYPEELFKYRYDGLIGGDVVRYAHLYDGTYESDIRNDDGFYDLIEVMEVNGHYVLSDCINQSSKANEYKHNTDDGFYFYQSKEQCKSEANIKMISIFKERVNDIKNEIKEYEERLLGMPKIDVVPQDIASLDYGDEVYLLSHLGEIKKITIDVKAYKRDGLSYLFSENEEYKIWNKDNGVLDYLIIEIIDYDYNCCDSPPGWIGFIDMESMEAYINNRESDKVVYIIKLKNELIKKYNKQIDKIDK